MDHEIPHIEICENETWKPKCAGDTRIIPLVGAALHAYQLMPSGHRGVFKKPDLFVNNVNKCLAKKGLIEKTDSIRSLRKQYETRLREAYVKDSLIHSITRIPPPIYTPCGLSLHERQMKKAPLIYLKISQFCMNKIKLDFTELMPC
ncbi:hypothetical protein BBC0122_018820 [Bartonella choladocola]|uniref:Uncharacterized protein n=1 Tax=Bartonella choladocola TaxID=2750995 RepID=A0A1U9MJ41_9HYPH|nr:hypothetical protein BBC0122_018820 [Bartonella choladocola]